MVEDREGSPPQPLIDQDSAPYWDALSGGELRICRCQDCRLWHMPPLERCRRCAGPLAPEPVSGTGTVHSFVVVHYPAIPYYAPDLPYVVALVDLDEQPGLRLPGRVDLAPDEVRIGQGVAVTVRPLAGGAQRIPWFIPLESPDAPTDRVSSSSAPRGAYAPQ